MALTYLIKAALFVGADDQTGNVVRALTALGEKIDHVWIGGLSAVAAITGLGGAAVAWFWRERRDFYDQRLNALKSDLNDSKAREQMQEERVKAAMATAIEAGNNSPKTIEATVQSALEWLQQQNESLRRELDAAKNELLNREAELAKARNDRAIEFEQRREIESEVEQCRARIRSLESELQSRASKIMHVEAFIKFAQEGFLDRGIVSRWTQAALKSAGYEATVVRAGRAQEKLQMADAAKNRSRIENYNRAVERSKKKERAERRDLLRAPLPEDNK